MVRNKKALKTIVVKAKGLEDKCEEASTNQR